MAKGDRVLAEVHGLIDASSSTAAQQAIVDVRSALAALGEELGNRVHASHAPAEARRGPLVVSAKPIQAKMKRITQPAVNFDRRPSRARLWVALIALACTGLLALWSSDVSTPLLLQPMPDIPAGMVGMENSETGTILIQTRRPMAPRPGVQGVCRPHGRRGMDGDRTGSPGAGILFAGPRAALSSPRLKWPPSPPQGFAHHLHDGGVE